MLKALQFSIKLTDAQVCENEQHITRAADAWGSYHPTRVPDPSVSYHAEAYRAAHGASSYSMTERRIHAGESEQVLKGPRSAPTCADGRGSGRQNIGLIEHRPSQTTTQPPSPPAVVDAHLGSEIAW